MKQSLNFSEFYLFMLYRMIILGCFLM